jgi:hypothetical protein
MRMNSNWLGAWIGAVMLAGAMPASAATFDGTSLVNSGGSVAAGDPALSFAPANLTNGDKGINGDDFTSGQQYFDYIFSFSLTGPADVTIASNPTVGTNLKDYHTALFSSLPDKTGLFFDSHSGLNIGLTNTTDLVASGGTTLSAANLGSGNYLLHLFGVVAGNSAKNSVLTGLSGTFTAAAVAATPIPAGLTLFVTALGVLGFMVWRRKAPGSVATA